MKKKVMKYNVCVIGGCGHVGLPLAILLASNERFFLWVHIFFSFGESR